MFGNLFNQKRVLTEEGQQNQQGGFVKQPQQQFWPQPPQSQYPPQYGQPMPPSSSYQQQMGQVSGAPGQTPSQQQVNSMTASQMDPMVRQNMSALSHLDERTTQVLKHAQEETQKTKQALIEPDQLLIGLTYDQEIFKLFEQFSVDITKLIKEIQAKEKPGTFVGQPTLSEPSKQVFEQAYRDAKTRGANFIAPEDLLLVLFSANSPTSVTLQNQGIKKEQFEEKISKSSSYTSIKKSVLEKYGIDLTDQAKEGKLDPIAGRDKEIDRLVHILLRRTKNNPIIIGEAGVGKTAIIEGLAQKIVQGSAPKDLLDKRIVQLDVASLVAGASHRGEFEERLRSVIQETMSAAGKIILFIDEIHILMGAGGESDAMNASNIIKPHLARGHLQIIGATTTSEYRKNFEKDKAFERRFQPVLCEEPSEENAIEMLKVLKPKYEKFHHVVIDDKTIEQAVKLSKKYVGERYLPDKAVDLLDEGSADVKLSNSTGKRTDNQLKKSDIEQVVSNWTGIPVTKLTEDEGAKLLKLEDRIHQRLIDQEEAVVAVSEAVRRGRIGLASGQRPIASFIFLGPSGTGKTELAKTLAEIMFGKDDAMIRLDMSEYMEKHEVAKLIGAPPGYVGYEEGGQLTEAVRAHPYSIVLLDEVEKAHPDVFNILLQLLEDGRLTDNKGNTISFKNTIVICTSNIGSAMITQKLAEQDTKTIKTPEQFAKEFAELSDMVTGELRKFFRPELLNRYDDIVIFKPLRREDMKGIAKLGLKKTALLLKEQGYEVDATETALAQLAKEGYDPMYGARPLRRLIQTSIENPIALLLIGKTFLVGDTILIDFDSAQNKFAFTKGDPNKSILKDAEKETQELNAPASPTQPGQQPQDPQNPGQVPLPGDPNAVPPGPGQAGMAQNLPLDSDQNPALQYNQAGQNPAMSVPPAYGQSYDPNQPVAVVPPYQTQDASMMQQPQQPVYQPPMGGIPQANTPVPPPSSNGVMNGQGTY